RWHREIRAIEGWAPARRSQRGSLHHRVLYRDLALRVRRSRAGRDIAEPGADDRGSQPRWLSAFRRTPLYLVPRPRVSDAGDPFLPHYRRRRGDQEVAESLGQRIAHPYRDRARAERGGADRTLLPTLLPRYGRGRTRFRRP